VCEYDDSHSQCVLQRFVRRFVMTYPARRSLRLLENAFQNAHAHRLCLAEEVASPCRPSLNSAFVLEKRRVLAGKYSVSCVVRSAPDMVVPKSTFEVYQPDDVEGHNSSSDSNDEEHVTAHGVVHTLFTQLQQARDEMAVKDRRVRELEALLASLVAENSRLSEELQALVSTKAENDVYLTASNQITQ
jgi:hypothetical protein